MEVLRSNRLLEKYKFPDKSMFLYESGTGMIIEYVISFKFRETWFAPKPYNLWTYTK